MSQDNTLRVILPGKLIDGIAGQAQEGMAVAIQGSSIKWVGPTSEAASLSTNGADREILEFTQGTLLAGMFDIHTHTNMPGDGRTGEQVNKDDNDEIRLLRSAQNAAAAIASGVTTMCDCGSWNRNGFALKEGLAEGIVEGPRVLVSGPPLTVTGGHLWYMGGEADGVDAVRSRVRGMVKQGADFIKIAASGGSTSTSDPYRAAYSAEELNAIVEEAHNFVPGSGEEKKSTPSLATIRKLLTEGRKFGTGVILISQRPNRLDETTLAQCNSFLILKLVNPKDQRWVQSVMEQMSDQDKNALKAFANGQAFISGHAVKFPLQVQVKRDIELETSIIGDEDFMEENERNHKTGGP